MVFTDLSRHAFVFRQASLIDLSPMDPDAIATAINEGELVTGSRSSPSLPVIWRPDGGTEFLPLGGFEFGRGLFLTQKGDVGGFVVPPGATHYEDTRGALWEDGGLTWTADGSDAGLIILSLTGVSLNGQFSAQCWLNGLRRACRVSWVCP
jgi:hypothetical protein